MQQPQQPPEKLDWNELPVIPDYPQDGVLLRRQIGRWLWPALLAGLVLFLNYWFSSLLPQWLYWAWFGFCFLWFILSLWAKPTHLQLTLMTGAAVCTLLFLLDFFLGSISISWASLVWPTTWPIILASFTILLNLKADPPWWWSWIWPILLATSVLVLAFLIGKMSIATN